MLDSLWSRMLVPRKRAPGGHRLVAPSLPLARRSRAITPDRGPQHVHRDWLHAAPHRVAPARGPRRARRQSARIDRRRSIGRLPTTGADAAGRARRRRPLTASSAATRSTPSSSATPTSSPRPPARRSPSCRRKAYNPLFIYGGVGLGKTHLLHAVGHQIARLYPRLSACSISRPSASRTSSSTRSATTAPRSSAPSTARSICS